MTTEEPIVLPSRIPQLLMNGSTGIAVGMATNIPPHNLTEICDALTALKGPLGNLPEFRKKIQSLVTDPAAKEKLLKELGGGEEKK